MQVMVQDQCGGGESIFLRTSDLLREIPAGLRAVLKSRAFPIRVPKEFDKGWDQIAGGILLDDERIRYRQDIVSDREALDEEAREALLALERGVMACEVERMLLPEGAVVLLDNARWLHGRTEVLDPRRHLLRVRFDL